MISLFWPDPIIFLTLWIAEKLKRRSEILCTPPRKLAHVFRGMEKMLSVLKGTPSKRPEPIVLIFICLVPLHTIYICDLIHIWIRFDSIEMDGEMSECCLSLAKKDETEHWAGASMHCTLNTLVNIDLLRSMCAPLRLMLAFYTPPSINILQYANMCVVCVLHIFVHFRFSLRWQITVVWYVNEWIKKQNTKMWIGAIARKQIHINCA